jgi:tetratricopeptide (TPR) repeat protein
LSVLIESELLYERGIYPESTLVFKNALTRDVVYDSIISDKRKRLHQKIGHGVETVYSKRLEQKHEVLAHHFGLSGCWEKAVHFARLAAEKAHKLSQFHQAATIYEQAVKWILNLPECDSQRECLVDTQLELCWSNIGLGQFGKVEEVALIAEATARALEDKSRLGIAYLGLGTAYVYRGDFVNTEKYALQAIDYLEKTNEEQSLAKANMLLGIGEYGLVQTACKNALTSIEGTPIRTGHVANVYYDMVLAELKPGNQDRARQHYEKGKPLGELAPHWWGARFLFLKGMLLSSETAPDFMEIEECFQKSIHDVEIVGAVVPAAQTRYYLAKMLSRKGEVNHANKLFRDLRDGFEAFDIPVWQHKCDIELEPYCF